MSSSEKNFHITLDPERDLQRIHSLVISHLNQIELVMCQPETFIKAAVPNKIYGIEEVRVMYLTLRDLRETALEIESKHKSYMRTLARDTKYGSL